jgi:hypothetical protein
LSNTRAKAPPFSALRWRRAYYFFVIVVPFLAFAAYLVAVLKTDSVHPVSDLHCDNTSPLWYVGCCLPGCVSHVIFIRPRLLGYAGAPIVLFTPCFILSIVTAVRILRMHAKIRELRTGEGDPTQTHLTRVVNGGSRLMKSGQSAAIPVSGVSDKLPPPTLDGHTSMTVDVRLHGSLSISSSRVSVPMTPRTIETVHSSPHFPIALPALPPMTFPSAYLSRPSPPSSTKDLGLPDVDPGRTPSPIVFARPHLPCSQHHAQLDAAGEPCHKRCTSSGCDPETNPPYDATLSEEPPRSPTSPSRAPISLEAGERMSRFHLPTRSPPSDLRPSLELSPEYARVRLEADGASLTRRLENLPPSPYSSHRQLLTSLTSGQSLDIIGSRPSITYMDRTLEKLPEVDGADRDSIMLRSEEDVFMDGYKSISPDSPEPSLKPVRQFYREQLFTRRLLQIKLSFNDHTGSAPRPSIGRPPGLHPAILSMVVFQLCVVIFFYQNNYKRPLGRS